MALTDNGFTETSLDHRLGFSALDRKLTLEDVPAEDEMPSWLSGFLVRNGPGT